MDGSYKKHVPTGTLQASLIAIKSKEKCETNAPNDTTTPPDASLTSIGDKSTPVMTPILEYRAT